MGRTPEVAFYGGTFSNLSIRRMKDLLEGVTPYIEKGLFRSIRVSTRPDTLDRERMKVMKENHVLAVELGAQSMDDEVLSLSQRGHTTGDTVSAVTELRRNGFKIGLNAFFCYLGLGPYCKQK